VIVGAEDIDSVLEGCRTVAAEIHEAALVELAGAAHLPNLERRAELDSVLTAFLS
jgi:pimeloyl-ACP methyl ester carboxylesterase